jgi:hypothetical protein
VLASAPARGYVRATIAYRKRLYAAPSLCGLKERKLPVKNPFHPKGRPLNSWCAFPTIASVLGETLREVRRRRGLSIEQLSKRSGVPARLIREIESQRSSYVPSEANTILLAEALRIPFGLLLGQREWLFEQWRPGGSRAAGSEELSA